MKRFNWQIKVLIFFLVGWILLNAEKTFFKVLDFLVTIPMNMHAFAGKVLGFENWSRVVTVINSPIFLGVTAIFIIAILIKIIHLFDSLKENPDR